MPELPDVECFRRMVRDRLIDQPVSHVTVADPASLAGATPDELLRRLHGRRLQGARRHGKYLFLEFGEDIVLVMHFGPAGALCLVSAGQDEPAYARVCLDFRGGDGLAYVNRRRIGRVRLIDSVETFISKTRLGPDALDEDFDVPKFAELLAGRDRPIKSLLMDQSKLSGIGNTWSDEILFQARIHPMVPAGSLNHDQSTQLFRCILSVLRTAIELNPAADHFRERLPANFLLPHRHPGGHCPRCGTKLEQVRLAGHTATFCPHCQAPAGGG